MQRVTSHWPFWPATCRPMVLGENCVGGKTMGVVSRISPWVETRTARIRSSKYPPT